MSVGRRDICIEAPKGVLCFPPHTGQSLQSLKITKVSQLSKVNRPKTTDLASQAVAKGITVIFRGVEHGDTCCACEAV